MRRESRSSALQAVGRAVTLSLSCAVIFLTISPWEGMLPGPLSGLLEGLAPGGAAARSPGANLRPGAVDLLEPRLLQPHRRDTPKSFTPAPAPFSLRVGERQIHYRVMALPVLPGELLEIHVPGAPGGLPFTLRMPAREEGGEAQSWAPGRWQWRAPSTPGIIPLRVVAPLGSDSVLLNMMVLHPREELVDGRLDDFRIGRYREDHPHRDPAYVPPAGFIRLGEDESDVLVSPHFTLGQFRVKQPEEPSYLALTPELVVKLEAVLARVNQAGHAVSTLHVMSGYRTPFYNRAIGNTTDFSRHLWGDAADIFVDAKGDGRMDDLNGDGRIDAADAQVLLGWVEEVDGGGFPGVLSGGLGLYPPTPARGPFIHVDTRGVSTRW